MVICELVIAGWMQVVPAPTLPVTSCKNSPCVPSVKCRISIISASDTELTFKGGQGCQLEGKAIKKTADVMCNPNLEF